MKRSLEESEAVDETGQDQGTDTEDEEGDEDGDEIVLNSRRRQQGLEPPGAPLKKKRRVLPWTDEGRLLWPEAEPLDGEKEEEEEEEEDSSDDCRSFVVDDDSESVTVEEVASERFLAGGALVEVRAALKEQMRKLRRRLVKVDRELAELGGDGSLLEGEERTCTGRGDVCCACRYTWESDGDFE